MSGTIVNLADRRSAAARKAAETRRARQANAPAPSATDLPPSLGAAVRALAAADSFTAADARFGRSLAALPEALWEPDTARLAWEMLRRYRGALARAGVDFARLPEPATAAPTASSTTGGERTLTLAGDHYEVRFPYDEEVVHAVKQLPGRKFSARPTPHWQVPAQHVATIKAFAQTHRFVFVDGTPSTPAATGAPTILTPPPATTCGSVAVEGEKFAIRFDRNFPRGAVDAVKELPGREWHFDSKTWFVPVRGNAARTVAVARKWGLRLPEGLEAAVREVQERTERLRNASSAADADFEVEGLAEGLSLLPYQRAGVAYASETRRCFIADEMGLGKTLQAMATVVHNKAFPAICIVPQAVRSNWAAEWAKFFPGVSVRVITGNKRSAAPGWEEFAALVREAEAGGVPDVTVINYDVLGVAEVEEKSDRITKLNGWAADLAALKARALIVDESHYAKTAKANRTIAVRGIAESIVEAHGKDAFILCLTGTPIENRPAEIIPQLAILGRLHEFGGPGRFKARYCRGEKSEQYLPELNDRLRATCYVRRTKPQVFTELPPIMRSMVPMDVDPKVMVEYRKAEEDVAEFLAQRAQSLAIESGLTDDDAVTLYWEKKLRIEAVAHLVVVGQLKALAAKAKLPAAKAWLRNFLASTDEKILVFGEHRDIVNDLQATLGCDKIQGGQTSEERQVVKERFQNGDARSLVLSMKAGGTGLTLTAASNLAFIEQGWTSTLHDQAEARCYGRANDLHGANAYYLLAPGTVDVRIARLIDEKRKVVAAVSDGKAIDDDGDEVTGSGSILGNLLVELAHEGLARQTAKAGK